MLIKYYGKIIGVPMFPSLICCKDAEVSRVRLTVKSPCCNRRKIVFRINSNNPKDLNDIFDKIKNLLSEYGELE
jgi:hypothetical protein